MDIATAPGDTRPWTSDQKKRVLFAGLTCLGVATAAVLAGWAGFGAGGWLADWVQRNPLGDESLDLSKVNGPLSIKGHETAFAVRALAVGASGVTVKLALDLVQWVPAVIQPLVDLEKGVPDEPLTARRGFKTIALALFGNWKALSAVFGALLTLNLAAGTLSAPTRVTPAGNNSFLISSGGSSFFLQLPATAPPESLSGRTFVVLFEEEDPKVSKPAEFSKGLQFTNTTTTEFLGTLATRLAFCNRGDRIVKVVVKGFASSSRFAKAGNEQASNDLNTQLATARATKVADILEKARPLDKNGQPLPASSVTRYTWRDFAEMSTQRGFEDRIGGDYSIERGQLNRRAEIAIDNAGACYR